jgi:tripartite ATP-independent transporter DctP family solute receptor
MSGLLRSLAVAAALTFGATVALTAPMTAQARDFRSADVHPADYPTVEAVKHMGRELAGKTNGKMNIRVFPSGALGSEKDTIEQLKLGGLDMMRINAGALNSVVPETLVTVLPFIFRDTAHMRSVLDGPIGDDILKAMEAQGLIGLAFYDSGARSFYTAKKPITSLADFKGLKIRVQPSELFVGMINALGANPTPMPYGEVYTALKTGIVDGAENNWPSYESSRHFEAARYYSLTEHSLAPEVLVFSKVIWDKLSKDDQALIRKAAKDSVPFMRKLWDDREISSRKMVEAGGAKITTIANKQELIDAMKPVYEKFANTPALQSLVTRIQQSK